MATDPWYYVGLLTGFVVGVIATFVWAAYHIGKTRPR